MYTVVEYRQIAHDLNELETSGQRETYGMKSSLVTNCAFCMWNMTYAMLFALLSMNPPLFYYCIMPTFWFFILSFAFQTRLILMHWRITHHDQIHSTQNHK